MRVGWLTMAMKADTQMHHFLPELWSEDRAVMMWWCRACWERHRHSVWPWTGCTGSNLPIGRGTSVCSLFVQCRFPPGGPYWVNRWLSGVCRGISGWLVLQSVPHHLTQVSWDRPQDLVDILGHYQLRYKHKKKFANTDESAENCRLTLWLLSGLMSILVPFFKLIVLVLCSGKFTATGEYHMTQQLTVNNQQVKSGTLEVKWVYVRCQQKTWGPNKMLVWQHSCWTCLLIVGWHQFCVYRLYPCAAKNKL